MANHSFILTGPEGTVGVGGIEVPAVQPWAALGTRALR